jgi:hypothetical protein
MKKFIILTVSFFVLFVSNGKAATFPPAHSATIPAFNHSGALTNVDLNGNYIYYGEYNDFYRSSLSSPTLTEYVHSTGGISIAAGDFDDNGIMYFTEYWTSNSGLYSIDLATGAVNFIGNLHGPDIGSFGAAINMSYYNGVMYSIFSISPYDYTASAVFKIDLTNGLCTRISTGTFPGFFTTLAINGGGVFYGIDASESSNGNLYLINPTLGTRTLVGSTGLYTWDYNDGDFDTVTGKFYLSCDYYNIGTYTINTTTGFATKISSIPSSFCAINTTSTGHAVPFGYLWIIIAFTLITGTLVVRKFLL